MKTLWRRFRDLSPFERAIALRAGAYLPVAAVTLRIAGLRRSLRIFGWLFEPRPFLNVVEEDVRRPLDVTIAGIVQAVARRHPLRSNCLAQSLVLWSLLRQWGLQGDLRIGVSKRDGDFAAHAWVERRGRILAPRTHWRQRFAVFDRSITPEA
jgi:hypothetical protein